VSSVRGGGSPSGTHGILVVSQPEARDVPLVEPEEARLQAAEGLLQRFRERAADRHHLADGLHRGGQHRVGAREFFEGEARDLGDHVVDGRLEGGGHGAFGDVVLQLVERVADGEPRRDLGDRKPVALEARAEERETRGFISITTIRPSAG